MWGLVLHIFIIFPSTYTILRHCFIMNFFSFGLLFLRAVRPMCALFSNVMPVKRIYILNVVVMQEILIKTGKQNRRRIVVLHATEFHSLQKYLWQNFLIHNTDSLKNTPPQTRNTFCGTWYLPHSHVHNERTAPTIMAGCMAHARNGYISTSGLRSDVTIVFLDSDFLKSAKISVIRVH